AVHEKRARRIGLARVIAAAHAEERSLLVAPAAGGLAQQRAVGGLRERGRPWGWLARLGGREVDLVRRRPQGRQLGRDRDERAHLVALAERGRRGDDLIGQRLVGEPPGRARVV